MTAPFRSFLQAGFEPGRLPWNGMDLLQATGHVPERNMATNYGAVQRLGIHTVRDGLPWRHDPAARLQAAADAGLQVIWDLCHFDPPPEPDAHAWAVARAARAIGDDTLWVCPMNEPAICSSFNPGFTAFELAAAGIDMLAILKAELPDVRCLTTDPIVGTGGEQEYAATDLMVWTGMVDVVGVNYYPHTARAPLATVLYDTWARYKLPVCLSETSWHNGHQDQAAAFPHIRHKADWLNHVLAEIRIAQLSGADVVGLCWYPATDMPAWCGGPDVWDNGLLRLNGQPDASLAQAFASVPA